MSATTITERTVDLAAGRIRVREAGTGPTVVLVHGALVNSHLWDDVIPLLADHHRVVAPDLPLGCHAEPVTPGTALGLPGQAEVVTDLLDALDLDDVTLVGNDTGGAVCQVVVTRHAPRVGRLVLTSCDAFENYPPKAVSYLKPTARVPPALWLLTQAMRLAPVQRLPIAYGWATHAPIEPRIMDSYLGDLRTNAGVRRDFAALLRAADRGQMLQASESLASFGGPALVVWAADDRFFPREHGQRLAELLPRGRFELVERSRTFIPEDQPAQLVELLRDFQRA
jgi:pimeloyl-ACP methyl ester carboxylesterase